MPTREEMLSKIDVTQKEQARVRHEATVTTRILKKLAPTLSIPKLKAATDGTNSVIHLGLIQEAIPNFPIRLFARNVPYLQEIGVNQLLAGDIFHLPMFKAYAEHIEQNGWSLDRGAIGMVMPWPTVSEVVLHNYPHGDDLIERRRGGGRFTMVTCKYSSPRVYYLEILDSLLEAIKKSL